MNLSVLKQLNSEAVAVDICLVRLDEAETQREYKLDETWSFAGNKAAQRWLWHAIEQRSGKILADVFENRKDEVFLQLKALLLPFGISRYYTDDWGAYERHLDTSKHERLAEE